MVLIYVQRTCTLYCHAQYSGLIHELSLSHYGLAQCADSANMDDVDDRWFPFRPSCDCCCFSLWASSHLIGGEWFHTFKYFYWVGHTNKMHISILWWGYTHEYSKVLYRSIGCICSYTLFCWEITIYVLIPTDPSLTPSNLTSAMDSLPERLWESVGRWMRVPESTLNKIESQFHTIGERKAALLNVYVTEHPEPTWEHVSDVLYRCNKGDKECHRTLNIVQSKYPTGVSFLLPFSSLSIFIHHTPPIPTLSSCVLHPSPSSPSPVAPLSLTPLLSIYILPMYTCPSWS